MLHGDRDVGGDSAWFVSDSPFRGANLTPLPSPPLPVFRPALARIGFHYMRGQLYGGMAEVVLSQEGRQHAAAIHMGNDSWRGHWVRVYVRPLDPASGAASDRPSI